ncbi:hypothetical protein [Litorimonas haliclonae]|uniref:hypothetical protein n=1 Tax=Litorimonas haliclonae TaxID=2081977 RepID=UPI0039EE7BC0
MSKCYCNFVKRALFLTLSGLIPAFGYVEASASAWTLKPGKAQLILTGAYSSADTLIGSEGDSVELQSFTKSDTRLYLEFGLFENIMMVGQTGYQFIDFEGAGSDVDFADFEETKLSLQYQIKRKEGLAASVLASYVLDGGLDDPRLNLGGRNNEIEVRALFGRSKSLKSGEDPRWVWFYDVQLGTRYDLKSSDISRWQLDLTAGIKPNDKWMGLAQLYGLDIQEQRNGNFIVPSTKQAKLELSIAYKIRPNQYIQIGALQTLAGRNLVKETGLFTGIWRKF